MEGKHDERRAVGGPPNDRRISRRSFLRYSAATGVAAAAVPGVASAQGGAVGSSRGVEVPDFEWDEVTIAELQRAMESGGNSSRRIVQDFIERIDQVDLHGPRLNSVIEINPDALAIADELDRERRGGHVRGPLHGVPILLKDNVATDDRMETTAGSLALLGSRPPRDAFIARRLREAGAVILGKTNLSEWANFRSFQSSSGWSGRAGQCLNPYVLDHNPSGSSSGSGAAVAASLAAAAIGTETDGSITAPACANSVVGLKPTLGLASRSGIIPIAHSQDTAGPMSRTVEDAAILLGAITGVDARDPITKESAGNVYLNYRRFLDPNGLRGARIGVWRQGNFGFSPEADAIVEDAIERIRGLGAEIVDPADIPNINEMFGAEFTVLLYEFKADIRAYLSELRNTRMRTLRDLINFNESHERAEMRWFGQELFHLSQTFGPLTEPAYLEALATSKRLARRGIDGVMDRHNLDAIVHPISGPPWTTDLVNGDHFFFIAGTGPAAVAGYPHINVPAGYTHRQLPVGISFTGRAWSEPALLAYAYAFEREANVRHAPRFLPSLGTEDFVPRAARPLGSEGRPAGSRASGPSVLTDARQASARPSLL